jgi:hypothetical protein
MKRKHLFLAILALLTAGGIWFARSAWRQNALHNSSIDVGLQADGGRNPGQMLRPPDPIRQFRDLTPEQRVQRARKGPVGG